MMEISWNSLLNENSLLNDIHFLTSYSHRSKKSVINIWMSRHNRKQTPCNSKRSEMAPVDPALAMGAQCRATQKAIDKAIMIPVYRILQSRLKVQWCSMDWMKEDWQCRKLLFLLFFIILSTFSDNKHRLCQGIRCTANSPTDLSFRSSSLPLKVQLSSSESLEEPGLDQSAFDQFSQWNRRS